MHIILLYKEDYPWDVRVEKIALSLKKHGHKVTIVARNLGSNPENDLIDGIEIIRLPAIISKIPILRKLVNFPVWFNPFWNKTLKRAIHGSNNPLIIVRDLPLARTAIRIAKSSGSKVFLDMAEVYPFMYASARQFSNKMTLEMLVKSPKFAERYESYVIPKLDHTFVMIEESRDRLVSQGINPNKVSIVSNTPSIEKFGGQEHFHDGENLRLVYVGFLTKLRGLDLLIKSASEYLKNGNSEDSLRIDIVGRGSEKEVLINMVKELKLENVVKIHGWLDHNKVEELMAKANVGALTYRVCAHWNHTIPNKIFDYMLAGLPVLTTEVTPIKRIITETEAGLVCRDQDVRDIAQKLETLKSPKLRAKLGRNGVQAIKSKYNWANDEIRLHAVIDSISE